MTERGTTRIEGGRRVDGAVRFNPPLVSIVTVVFRAAHELPPLIESIVANRTEDTELIVIDGGSEDGTLEVLRRFGHDIDYWLSEPDRGIYDAMNKGIAAASGEYVVHLNAGDRLRHIPSQELLNCRADKIDLAAFAVDMEGFGIHRPRPGLFLQRFAMTLHHQGAFYLRESHMGYDSQYPIHADFDLNQRMVIAGKSIRCFNIVVSKMGAGGVSSTGRTHGEAYRIIKRNFGLPYVCIAVVWMRISRAIPPLKRLHGYVKSISQRGSNAARRFYRQN